MKEGLKAHVVRWKEPLRVGCEYIPTMEYRRKGTIEAEEDFFRLIVESSADAVIVVDRGGIVSFLNPAAEQLFGRPAGQMLGNEFGFPLVCDIPQELDIVRAGQDVRVAEMRVVAIGQNNKHRYIANLRDITEIAQLREELRTLTLVDDLTGLHNRRGFLTLGEQQLKLVDRNREGMFLLFNDLDNMKGINDSYGHQEGDLALIEIASILRETFRKSDIIARVGGDEFAVLAIESHKESGKFLVDRLQENIKTHNEQSKHSCTLSISVGLTYYDPESPCLMYELLEQADRAMYEQKQNKRENT